MPEIDLNYKIALHEHCLHLTSEKVRALEKRGEVLQVDLNSASKSTAGDKHETTRAMLHLEQEKLASQIAEKQAQYRGLSQIKLKAQECFQLGTLLQTQKGHFYIATSLGKIEFKGEPIFIISPIAPLAQAFIQAQNTTSIHFNGMDYSVLKFV